MQRMVMYNNDARVASFLAGEGRVADFKPERPELLPMQINRTDDGVFLLWLEKRAIDLNNQVHRRLIYELLGTRDVVSVALLTHMFSITDTFTCFPEGEFVPRSTFLCPQKEDPVSEYVLISSDTSLRNANRITPNASTDGSFTKTWKYVDGAWWLYKIQPYEATKAEVEISRVLSECGWDTAFYDYDEKNRRRVRTKNFLGTDEFFEPYESFRYLFTDRSDNEKAVMANLVSVSEQLRSSWKRILIADAVFCNTDRHMRNFGVIRSAATGDVLRLAPNFDNNQAFKANPGGYSSAMLDMYMLDADNEDRANLNVLAKAMRKHKYLEPAMKAMQHYLL